ncbi:MAG: FAD-dependent oxidoreductase [Eubacteriales bacterium]|nr:FAD-dependent oxidoreductase [Eubacteriales bacterium]
MINKNNSLIIGMGNFDTFGGWLLDTQFVANMGFPYLLAHGIGEPVDDATTKVNFPEKGIYRMFVYTYNWVAPWKPQYAPGRFQIKLNQNTIDKEFGTENDNWSWEYGGEVEIDDTNATLSLCDLTGFEGRCGLILFTQNTMFTPPQETGEIIKLYKKLTNQESTDNTLQFDMIVAGGGIAGICCALSCARQGLKTALIQDRGVVGGNNSSEVRVWLGGETNYEPFPGIGNIVNELEQARKAHYGSSNTGDLYEDDNKEQLLRNEENLSLFLNHILTDVVTDGDKICEVEVFDIPTGKYKKMTAPLYADCTGDGTVGAMAGADFEVTTNGHMGMTNHWHLKNMGTKQTFPRCPWAIDLTNCTFPGRKGVKDVYNNQGEISLGVWFWESGCELDPIDNAEYARDTNLRAMYGAVDCLKNVDNDYENYKIGFCGHIGGKRESRRLFGDVILTKSDVYKGTIFEDSCIPSTWNFDVHYPDKRFYGAFYEGDGFITKDYHERFNKPYFVPYRCLYSRNLSNMFMAGRNVSVSHDALGTVRVMRTGGMMGEVIGYAAAICKSENTLPRDVYSNHLDKLMSTLKGIPKIMKKDQI